MAALDKPGDKSPGDKSPWTIAGEAASLEEARHLLENLRPPPDLIILDISLRDKEWGLELVPWLAAQYGAQKRAPPVLVYSVYADYAHIKTAFHMGVQGYISKAEGLAELEAAMETVVQGNVYVDKKMMAKLSFVPELIDGLTKREREIFMLVQQGLDNRRIAEQLSLNLRSVENYISRIYDKTGVKTRRELQDL
ncbi:DNA-binding response regulator [Spirochaetia bacterium]|nr:DNA-binding response regulator [Spirochaetia bacterium]